MVHFAEPLLCHVQIDLIQGMLDCLYAKCIPCITDCVMAELEKLGTKYRVALKVAKVSGDMDYNVLVPRMPVFLPDRPQMYIFGSSMRRASQNLVCMHVPPRPTKRCSSFQDSAGQMLTDP